MGFNKWLSGAGSQDGDVIYESPNNKTSDLLSIYLGNVTFKQIMLDVKGGQDQSPNYVLLDKSSNNLYRAVLLYATLAIDEIVIIPLKNEKQIILKAINEDIKALYVNYFDQPLQRGKNLVRNFEAFLTIMNKEPSYSDKIKELYYISYLILCLTQYRLNNLSPWAVNLASWFSIDTQKFNDDVVVLMKLIEEKPMKTDDLEKSTTEANDEQKIQDNVDPVQSEDTNASEIRVEEADPQAEIDSDNNQSASINEEQSLLLEFNILDKVESIQSYFDAQYLVLFLKESNPQERLKSLLELSNKIKVSLDQLNQINRTKLKPSEQKQLITSLLDAFNQNDSLAYGRKYFKELKEEHLDAYNLLLELSTDNITKWNLLNFVDEHEEVNIRNSVFYIGSTFLSPFITLSRLLPTDVQNSLANWTPTTADSEAKKLIKELAQSVLTQLNNSLESLEKQKEDLIKILGEDQDLTKLLTEASSSDLLKLIESNTVNTSYEDLESKLKIEPEVLVAVKVEEIQNALQQRYRHVMQSEMDEKNKVNTLITSMRTIVSDLTSLKSLKIERNAIVEKKNSLESLVNVFNQHADNKLIGSIASDSLNELSQKLKDLDIKIDAEITKFALDEQQNGQLKQISAEELNELIEKNAVAPELDLSKSAVSDTKKQFSKNRTSVQNYFIKEYRSLVNDGDEKEKALDDLLIRLNTINDNIKPLIKTRQEEYDALALKSQHSLDALTLLQEKKANPLLINLVNERSNHLNNELNSSRKKLEPWIKNLTSDEQFIQVLLTEAPSSVEQILQINTAVTECIYEYKHLKEKIILLDKIKQETKTLDDYVTEHNTLWVQLTNFLAQFWSIFKTDAGRMIDSAKFLKKQLLVCQAQCEQEINAHENKISEDTTIGSELSKDFSEKSQQNREIKENLGELKIENARSLLSSVSIFKPKPQLPKEQNAPSCDPDPKGLDY